MLKALRILTSRWLQAAVLLVWIVALRFRLQWLLIFAVVSAAAVVTALVAAFLVGMRRTRDAWKKFPDTPEYAEYAAARDRKQMENEKNRIETH